MGEVYGSPEWLDELRTLLLVGFLLTCLLVGLLFGESAPARPRRPGGRAESKAYCPLHRRIVGECPPGSHDV